MNDPMVKRQEIIDKGFVSVKDGTADQIEWFPVRIKGKWAIPADFDMIYYMNPAHAVVQKAKKLGKFDVVLEELAEARYYYWISRSMGKLETYAQEKRYQTLTRRLGIPLKTKTDRLWPSGWEKKLLAALAKGLNMHSACKKLKLQNGPINVMLKNYPDFRANVDAAIASHQELLVDALDEIGLKGKDERNRLNAIKFHLERRYSKDYGARTFISEGEVVSPMDTLVGFVEEDDEEDTQTEDINRERG